MSIKFLRLLVLYIVLKREIFPLYWEFERYREILINSCIASQVDKIFFLSSLKSCAFWFVFFFLWWFKYIACYDRLLGASALTLIVWCLVVFNHNNWYERWLTWRPQRSLRWRNLTGRRVSLLLWFGGVLAHLWEAAPPLPTWGRDASHWRSKLLQRAATS